MNVITKTLSAVLLAVSSFNALAVSGGSMCKQVAVVEGDRIATMSSYQPGYNLVLVKDQHVVIKGGGVFEKDLSFHVQSWEREQGRVYAGREGNDLIIMTLEKDGLYVAVHQYNTTVDNTFNGINHTDSLIRHVYLRQCK